MIQKDTDKTDLMKQIRDEVWNLESSPLYVYRTQSKYYPVLGEGSHNAPIVFIGEAPGKNEAETGRPFCGAAGRILTELIESVGMRREDVYITNIVKDRPPNNRDPYPEEIAIYSPFLDQQLSIVKPKIIATLGRFSMKYILEKYNAQEKDQTISELHGKLLTVTTDFGEIKILPLYHPAVALYNGGSKKTLLEDFKVIKKLL